MIKGLISPILSPFDDNLSFNHEMYKVLAEDLLSSGCAGLAPFGTTGEALSLSNAERINALEYLIKSGIPANKLIPGTGLCNFPDTVNLCRNAIEMGCHGVMTLPAFYYKGVTDSGLFEYFKRLIDEINDPNLKIFVPGKEIGSIDPKTGEYNAPKGLILEANGEFKPVLNNNQVQTKPRVLRRNSSENINKLKQKGKKVVKNNTDLGKRAPLPITNQNNGANTSNQLFQNQVQNNPQTGSAPNTKLNIRIRSND